MRCLGVWLMKEEFAWTWESGKRETSHSEASTVKLGEEQRWIPTCPFFFGVLLLLPPAGLLINSNPWISSPSDSARDSWTGLHRDKHFPPRDRSRRPRQGHILCHSALATVTFDCLWFLYGLKFVYPRRHLRLTAECLFLSAPLFSSRPSILQQYSYLCEINPLSILNVFTEGFLLLVGLSSLHSAILLHKPCPLHSYEMTTDQRFPS